MECAGTLSWSEIGFGSEPERVRRNPSKGVAADRDQSEPALSHAAAGTTQERPISTQQSIPIAAAEALLETEPIEIAEQIAHRIRRCMDGDARAWAELVSMEHRRVYGLCYRFTSNGADAEDLTQEVFLKLYANLATFDVRRGSLSVWIATITRNLLVDNFRRNRNQRRTGSLDEGWNESPGDDRIAPLIDRLPSRNPSQHDMAVRRELQDRVQSALAEVSFELREAVILRDLEDMDYKEIALVLSVPEGTVKSRISRGRAELGRRLQQNRKQGVQ